MAKLDGVKVIEASEGVIEKVAYEGAEYVLTEETPKEADLIRINTDLEYGLVNGDFHLIEYIDGDGDPCYRDNDGDIRCRYTYDTYSKVEADVDSSFAARLSAVESDVAALKGEATGEGDSEEPLKVGDYAKVIQSGHGQEGTIIELLEYNGLLDFRSRKMNGDIGDGFYHSHLARATPSEIAAVKEDAKWAKIGREKDEYKEGDVVYYEDSTWFENSGLGVVRSGGVRPLIKAVDFEGDEVSYDLCMSKLKLVTPVESRFDV